MKLTSDLKQLVKPFYIKHALAVMKHKVLYLLLAISYLSKTMHGQTFNIILGRPTDTSITASLLFDQPTDFYLEYGTATGTYSSTTSTITSAPNVPEEIDLHSLLPNTSYYYRLQYKSVGASTFLNSSEYTFHTQRMPGSDFVFTIEADEHLYDKKGVKSIYQLCLQNQAKDKPDFMLSLGDIFGDDHNWSTITSGALDTLHRNYRPILGNICHSIPFFICLGNHEGENDYYYNQNPGNNLCVWGTQWRKYYYPNPYPNGFYTGNTDNEPYGIGNPENYYSWTWGDALFVVLDVYRDECDTSAKPIKWDWSLGLPQYTWLKNTLENSSAKYKFVFAHHIRGQGRGGVNEATQFEWGGLDGGTDKFAIYRPGWAKPIHKLFVDNGVNIFFQGHDHLFAHEILDSVTYQEVPMPSDSTYQIGMLANAGAYVSDTLDGTGHIRVTVNEHCVKVDYVRAYLPQDTVSGIHHNGEVAFSYSIGSCWPSSVSNLKSSGDVTVFPNPAMNTLTIETPASLYNATFSIHNLQGQTLLESRSNRIDVSMLCNGFYFLTVANGNDRIVKKISINK